MNDFSIIYKFLKRKFSSKYNEIKNKYNTQSFTDIIMQPDGAKYLNSIYMGKNKIYGYNTTLYKIKREDNSYYYASYVYKKQFTQVILTDDWEKMKEKYQLIYTNNQSLILDVDDNNTNKGGVKNAKTKYGRKKI